MEIQSLIELARSYNPDVDADLIRRAYDYALKAHEGQTRASGAPYIEHPLAVAHVLAELQSSAVVIAAGLLHDVVEDTKVDLSEIEAEFGEDIARMVDGVTKLSRAELERQRLEEEASEDRPPLAKTEERAANVRKIFLAMARDVRVMIIKLADRLHNMRTLDGLPPEKQARIAEETLQIFAPIAHRLGIWHFKWQLEDLGFKYLYREEHDQLADALARTRRDREKDVEEVREVLAAKLKEQGISAEIQGRAKHLYSIHNKLRREEISLDHVYDLAAIRVIVNTVSECYMVLGAVHQLWLPIPGLFADYIARPKPNMYQSLHTKVLGPVGDPVEIQIRTWEMHQTADYGIAAHWNYKEGGRPDRRYEEKLTWLRQQLFDWQSDSSSDTEFMRSVVDDLFADQVFVFTPRGDVIDLPQGSGPLDFAFRIHSEIGLHCAGARVNGRQVPLHYAFKNGDIVEIQTRASASPSWDWLKIVKTTHARTRISGWMRKQRFDEGLARGREILEKEAHRQGVSLRELSADHALLDVARLMNYTSVEDLMVGISSNHVPAQNVINRLRKKHEEPKPVQVVREPVLPESDRLDVAGIGGLASHRADCCLPVPGEPVVGFVTRGSGLTIHRQGCANAEAAGKAEPERIQAIIWEPDEESRYRVRLRISTLDKMGTMATISGAISSEGVNIAGVIVRSKVLENATWQLDVDVRSNQELMRVIERVNALPDVLDVTRPRPRLRARRLDAGKTPARPRRAGASRDH